MRGRLNPLYEQRESRRPWIKPGPQTWIANAVFAVVLVVLLVTQGWVSATVFAVIWLCAELLRRRLLADDSP